jgi:hypothetical protein
MRSPAVNGAGLTPHPGSAGPVLLLVAGGAVSQAAIARTAELAAGAPVTVVGLSTGEISRTDAVSAWSARPIHPAGEARRGGSEPEQIRRTVALAMSVLEDTGVMAMGHIVTGPPARAVARMARARGARVVILDAEGRSAGAGGLMAELRRRMYGSGIVVLAETDRRGGWVSVKTPDRHDNPR